MTIDFAAFGVVPGDAEQTIGFFLADTFAMLPFVSALEPLRAANRFSGKPLYRWELFGETAAEAQANNAMRVPVTSALQDASRLDRLIVCGPHNPLGYEHAPVIRALKRLAGEGCAVGALDTGCFLLARADLIRGARCTVHWENLPGFAESYPGHQVSQELYEIDGKLFTCAGGTAALDMMLKIVAMDHGEALAARAAELFIHTGQRRASDPQRFSIIDRTGVFHPRLVSCIELMEAHVEHPLATSELAARVHVSVRHLERLFRAHLSMTPTSYYQRIRLLVGQQLLRQSTLSVLEVASSCGFTSADYFSRRYRALFGVVPSHDRQRHSDH